MPLSQALTHSALAWLFRQLAVIANIPTISLVSLCPFQHQFIIYSIKPFHFKQSKKTAALSDAQFALEGFFFLRQNFLQEGAEDVVSF